jgi:tagatose 6-phosphate kinase
VDEEREDRQVILTVTLNTALDITYRVKDVRLDSSIRVREVATRAGGKGLNVSRVLAALGHRSTVTGLVGGTTGEEVRADLAAASAATGDGVLTDGLVPVRGATRRTVTVVSDTGEATVFNEPGPQVSPAEWATFLETYRKLVTTANAVALCGSLPPGLPSDAYAVLVRAARAQEVPVLLDTSGVPLQRGLQAGPDLVKPNANELHEATGIDDPRRAATTLLAAGTGAVVVSLGAEGVYATTGTEAWLAMPPAPLRGNPTGAGDSAVAGLLSALVEGLPWPQRLTRAVALSAATVHAPVAGEFDAATYRSLLSRIHPAATPPPIPRPLPAESPTENHASGNHR